MNYEEIVCDANNLYRAYKVSVKSSKWKESTQKFMMNFLRYIFEIQDDLINRTLQNGPTQEFELHERGRIRPITSIQIRDRIVRHSLCDEVLLPEVRKHIIYDNCASIKGRGISQQRKRFEIHLHKYYQLYGNDGYILFGDFSKFYDNIIHEIAKRELLKLFNDDEFIDWLLTLIFKGFQIDVSYMSDEEYETCMIDTFNKLEYRNIPKEKLTGEKWMEKSVNIGDQLSQVIGIYYPYPIDNYVKYVRQQKFYGRYMDDWYIMNPSKEELENLLENVCKIAAELGIHINRKKTRIVKISSKYKFLQIKYTLTDTGKVIKRINPDRVTAMRRKLKKLAVKVENEEADYDNVENMFRGWMGGHYKLLSREQRKNLIQLYEDLFSKEITIVNKKLIVSDRSARRRKTMEPWFQVVLTIFSSVLASSGLWAYLQKKSEQKDVKTEMLIGLAHDRIMYLGMSYIDRGCVTQDEYENLRVYLYEPYERMGGNGSAKRIMQEVDKLPIHKFIEKEEEHNEHE